MGNHSNQRKGLRVGFFPGPKHTSRWSREIHPWSALASSALEEQGCAIQFLSREEVIRIARQPELDLLHINWPQSLANPESHKRRKYLSQGLYRRWFISHVARSMRALERLEIPVIWQVHDLPYSPDQSMDGLFRLLFASFFRRADGLLFYERSAQPPVFEMFGDPGPKPVGVAHLGSYTEMHGEPVERKDARERLRLSKARKVFLYAGTARPPRSPEEFIKKFSALSAADDVLIVTGRGTAELVAAYRDPRLIFRPGMVAHDEFRDMVCASDFVINDAYRSLGSAIIRVALGYGIPVIARSFGCTADIARDAYIVVEETPDGLEKAIRAALSVSAEKYRAMERAAFERHQERPWSAYGRGCIELYRRVTAARSP